MKHLKLLAALFDKGLECSVFSIDNVIHWSDDVIESVNKPPYEFIELSMMSSAKINEIRNKLFEFYKDIDIDVQYVVSMLLAVINQEWNSNQLDIPDAVKSTVQLLAHTDFYIQQEYYELYRLDDAYDLAVAGIYGNLKDVTKEFTQAISQYEPYYSHFVKLYKLVMGSEWKLKY